MGEHGSANLLRTRVMLRDSASAMRESQFLQKGEDFTKLVIFAEMMSAAF